MHWDQTAGSLPWHTVGPEFLCCLSGGYGRPAVSFSGLALSADQRSSRLSRSGFLVRRLFAVDCVSRIRG